MSTGNNFKMDKRQLLLEVSTWVQLLGASIQSFFRIIFMSRPVSFHIKRNSTDCVIIANGPSSTNLIKNHFDFIQDKDVLVVNYFPLAEEYTRVMPSFLVFVSPELWLEKEPYAEMRNKTIERLCQLTTWPITVILPVFVKKQVKETRLNAKHSFVKIQYINTTAIEGFRPFRHFLFKKGLGMPRPHNVLIPSLMTGLNMNYECIYLWGVDHSWICNISVDDSNTVLVLQKHFYEKEDVSAKVMKTSEDKPLRLHTALLGFYTTFKGYFILKEYADSKKIKIYNSTRGSFIDAFDRFYLD